MKLLGALLLLPSISLGAASLTFGGASSDRLDCGSGVSLDDLITHTAITWIYPTTITAGKGWFNKEANVKNAGGINGLRLAGSTGQIRVAINQSVTNAGYITTNSTTVVNTWKFVAYTYDQNATPRIHIYVGTSTGTISEPSYQSNSTDGSGTMNVTSSSGLIVGNESTANQAFQGQIGFVAEWNRVLTMQEVQDQKDSPHITQGNVFFLYPGFQDATSLQVDLSGNGNHCTVFGATASSVGPPISIGGGPL